MRSNECAHGFIFYCQCWNNRPFNGMVNSFFKPPPSSRLPRNIARFFLDGVAHFMGLGQFFVSFQFPH